MTTTTITTATTAITNSTVEYVNSHVKSALQGAVWVSTYSDVLQIPKPYAVHRFGDMDTVTGDDIESSGIPAPPEKPVPSLKHMRQYIEVYNKHLDDVASRAGYVEVVYEKAVPSSVNNAVLTRSLTYHYKHSDGVYAPRTVLLTEAITFAGKRVSKTKQEILSRVELPATTEVITTVFLALERIMRKRGWACIYDVAYYSELDLDSVRRPGWGYIPYKNSKRGADHWKTVATKDLKHFPLVVDNSIYIKHMPLTIQDTDGTWKDNASCNAALWLEQFVVSIDRTRGATAHVADLVHWDAYSEYTGPFDASQKYNHGRRFTNSKLQDDWLEVAGEYTPAKARREVYKNYSMAKLHLKVAISYATFIDVAKRYEVQKKYTVGNTVYEMFGSVFGDPTTPVGPNLVSEMWAAYTVLAEHMKFVYKNALDALERAYTGAMD